MNYPIRVLCVFSTLDRGGAETMCMNLYRKIDRSKVQFDFVKHTPDKGAYEDEIRSLGGDIYTAPEYKVKNHFSYCRWWKKHFINHPEHVIIHGHYFTISAVYFMVAKKYGRITVGHIHASNIKSTIKKIYLKFIKYETDYPLACSRQAGEWIYGKRPFTVLKNALDTYEYKYNDSVRREYRELLGFKEELIIGTVANFSEVKNPMGLIDIFIEVLHTVPSAKLLWVGEGILRNRIEKRIKQEYIDGSVVLLGKRNDVSKLLQAMDVFLLPSFNEGLPLSVIEAQAAGLPCFISDKITRETDITNLCCFLPIDQPKYWAQAITNNHIRRIDTSDLVKKAGYDANVTACWLQNFYICLFQLDRS